jgi:predicted MFS family arabinose efflux permease
VRCGPSRWWSATRGGAKALGLDHVVGSLEPGKKADVVLIKNEHSPVMFPLLNPYGHVVFQAQRGDVHTVLVNGRVVKQDHRLVDVDLGQVRSTVEATVEHLNGALGPEAWVEGMHPDIRETKILDNAYTYTQYRSATTHGGWAAHDLERGARDAGPRLNRIRRAAEEASMSAAAHASTRRLLMPPLAAASVLGVGVSWNLTNVGAAADTVASHFQVGLPAVGVLTSALFVAQFLLQVPIGRLIDRVGVRPAGIACLLISLGANGLVLLSPPFAAAVALRFVTGIALALGFVAGSAWARSGAANAFAQGVYGASAIAGSGVAVAVVPLLTQAVGWTAPFASAAAVCGIGLAALFLASAPPPRTDTPRPRLASVLTDRRVLRFASINVATFSTSIVLGNWIVPYLQRHGSYEAGAAGLIGGLILIGAMAGRLVGGAVGRKAASRARRMVVSSMAAGASATVVLALLAARPFVAVVCVLVVGVAAGLPFGTVFDAAARARPDAPAAAIALVSAPAVAAIFVGTPLVGLTFQGPGRGLVGMIAVGALWGAAILLVPATAAFPGGSPSPDMVPRVDRHVVPSPEEPER